MTFIERLLRLHPSLQVQNDKRDYVEQILASMKRDGRQMLHVVADFDYTLTMYEKDDVTLPSTHAVVESDDRVKVRHPSGEKRTKCRSNLTENRNETLSFSNNDPLFSI